jgi:hypothetical protein
MDAPLQFLAPSICLHQGNGMPYFDASQLRSFVILVLFRIVAADLPICGLGYK